MCMCNLSISQCYTVGLEADGSGSIKFTFNTELLRVGRLSPLLGVFYCIRVGGEAAINAGAVGSRAANSGKAAVISLLIAF
jgi:hypothetical protein